MRQQLDVFSLLFYQQGPVLILDVDPLYVFHDNIKLKLLERAAKYLEDRLDPPTDCSKLKMAKSLR